MKKSILLLALPIMAFQFHPERMTEDPHFFALMRASLSSPKEDVKFR